MQMIADDPTLGPSVFVLLGTAYEMPPSESPSESHLRAGQFSCVQFGVSDVSISVHLRHLRTFWETRLLKLKPYICTKDMEMKYSVVGRVNLLWLFGLSYCIWSNREISQAIRTFLFWPMFVRYWPTYLNEAQRRHTVGWYLPLTQTTLVCSSAGWLCQKGKFGAP